MSVVNSSGICGRSDVSSHRKARGGPSPSLRAVWVSWAAQAEALQLGADTGPGFLSGASPRCWQGMFRSEVLLP